MSKGNRKASITDITKRLDQIRILTDECIAMLASFGPASSLTSSRVVAKSVDLTIQVKAVVKRHAKNMSGPEKFTLLLAWLAKGDPKTEVQLGSIISLWNKMSAKNLLGGKFNHFYPSQAKTNDWVESKKTANYNLRPGWQEIFKA
jgi:hypothetical protein